MNKVKTLDDLRKMRETLRSTLDIREKSNHPEQMVQIRISMATCGIAAGAKEIMNYFIEALDREKVDALVTQTGCMGYCYAEPTVEVDRYIRNGELLDDIIPVTYTVVKPE